MNHMNPWTKHVHAEMLRVGKPMSLKDVLATFGRPAGRLEISERMINASRRGYFKRNPDLAYEALPKEEGVVFWTEERLAILHSRYPEIGSKVHKELGTTRAAIHKKASDLGIRFIKPEVIPRKVRDAMRKGAQQPKPPKWDLPSGAVNSVFNLSLLVEVAA